MSDEAEKQAEIKKELLEDAVSVPSIFHFLQVVNEICVIND